MSNSLNLQELKNLLNERNLGKSKKAELIDLLNIVKSSLDSLEDNKVEFIPVPVINKVTKFLQVPLHAQSTNSNTVSQDTTVNSTPVAQDTTVNSAPVSTHPVQLVIKRAILANKAVESNNPSTNSLNQVVKLSQQLGYTLSVTQKNYLKATNQATVNCIIATLSKHTK